MCAGDRFIRAGEWVRNPPRASATHQTRTAMAEMVLHSIAQALAGKRPEFSLTT